MSDIVTFNIHVSEVLQFKNYVCFVIVYCYSRMFQTSVGVFMFTKSFQSCVLVIVYLLIMPKLKFFQYAQSMCQYERCSRLPLRTRHNSIVFSEIYDARKISRFCLFFVSFIMTKFLCRYFNLIQVST